MELKDLPGAFYCENGEGPVLKLLKSIKDRFDIGNASGALYELEVASFLQARGEVISFGERLRSLCDAKDFDIVTKTTLIECKSMNWSKYDKKFLTETCKKINDQALIARSLGKEFILYSKHTMPDFMKERLTQYTINFVERLK